MHFVRASGVVSTPALFYAANLQSSSPCTATLKSSATGKLGGYFCNGSKVFAFAFPENEPTFRNVEGRQRLPEIQYTGLLDLQMKCSPMVMLCRCPSMMVVICRLYRRSGGSGGRAPM